MIGLARMSGYDIRLEIALNILFATGTLVLFVWPFFRATRTSKIGGFPWILPVFSLLVYSLNQGENWLWGWQVQIFLNVLAVVAGCLLLGSLSERFSRGRMGAAMAMGVVALYSFANGLVYWVIGLMAVAALPLEKRKQRWLAVSAWLLVMTGIFLAYFHEFVFDSPSGKPWFYFILHPLIYLRYVLQYLGAAIINYEMYALVFGLLGLLFFGWMTVFLWRRQKAAFRLVMPFFLLGLYAVGSAMLTGIGRVGFGPVQAMSYRYVTFSSLLWVANFVYLFYLLKILPGMVRKRGTRLSVKGVTLLFAFLLLLGVVRTSYRVGHRVFVSHHHRLAPVYLELRRGYTPSDDLLRRLYIDADYVRQGLNILQKYHLSVFRRSQPRVEPER